MNYLNFKKPVLLVGGGVRAAGATQLVIDFAHKTNIPVLSTMNALDIAQDDLRIGMIGTYGNRWSNMILEHCDLVISVGARLGLRQIGHKKEWFASKAKLVRADVDQAELSRNVKDDEEKHLMDARDFMKYLATKDFPDCSEWKKRCLAVKELLAKHDNTEGNDAVEAVAELLPPNPICVIDIGQHQCWCAQSLALKGYDGRILIGGGYGSMGCGLPYAIGASISINNGIVYCITGDGGLQMNIQELETVKRENLPIKIIVFNNHVLGKISEIQHGSYHDHYAQTTAESGYTVPDFQKVAEAYGIKAANIPSYHELKNYKDWLCDDQPCLINMSLNPDTLLIPKIKWETGLIMPLLDEELNKKVLSILNY
jgi:acetolactate synthase-1/2/3 large subunit